MPSSLLSFYLENFITMTIDSTASGTATVSSKTTKLTASVGSANASAATAPSSGTVAASTLAPVGEVATDAVLADTAEKKTISAGGLIFTADAQTLLADVAATGNAQAINAIEAIKTYMAAMAPGKPMNAVDGGHNQVLFYRTMQNVINLVERDFQLLFATILKLVADNSGSSGVFGPTYFVRWSATASLSPDDRKGFVRLCNLLMATAPVQGREQALRHVDMQRTLEFGFSEAGKKRVMAFYGK